MRIVVGLGNPGREYRGTRHNIGYMTLDILAKRWDVDVRRRRFKAVLGEGLVVGQRTALVKPTTFMNNSGECVRDVMNWYKCAHDELIVICDDIDLPMGDIRIRAGGSAGTHNGMRSVIYQLGYDDFPRIRVGIGRADGQKGLIAHVLGEPTGEEAALINKAMEDAADAAELIINGRIQDAQARFNRKGGKKAEQTDGENAKHE